MRRLQSIKYAGKYNDLHMLWQVKNPIRTFFNFLIIYACRFIPSLNLKNFLYRLTGMKVGKGAAVAFGATLDFFYPELIELGEGCIIGYNATILAHEFLINEYRIGKVEIGNRALIGANCTILPGVKIGDGATVSAMSLVNSDVAPGAFVGGVPAVPLKRE
jgi:acetyltransferase-like isoleucine patch superfamily enzyme